MGKQSGLFDGLPQVGGPAFQENKAIMDDPFSKKKKDPRQMPSTAQQLKSKRDQVIFGNIPSKSNCYVIITMKPKKDAPKKVVKCKSCDGAGKYFHDSLQADVPCSDCHGAGEVYQDPKGHASLAKSAALKKYEKDFFIQCGQYRNMMWDQYFELEVDVYYPTQRSDLDNCLKVLLDCLQGVKAIKNDNKCVRIEANKFLDPKNPRIEFTLKAAMKP